MGRDGVYRFVTGSAAELLDIVTLRNRMPPGLFLPRRHKVTQTRGYFPRHARPGRGYEPKTVVVTHGDGSVIMANGGAPVPPIPWKNGGAPAPPVPWKNGGAPAPPVPCK